MKPRQPFSRRSLGRVQVPTPADPGGDLASKRDLEDERADSLFTPHPLKRLFGSLLCGPPLAISQPDV